MTRKNLLVALSILSISPSFKASAISSSPERNLDQPNKNLAPAYAKNALSYDYPEESVIQGGNGNFENTETRYNYPYPPEESVIQGGNGNFENTGVHEGHPGHLNVGSPSFNYPRYLSNKAQIFKAHGALDPIHYEGIKQERIGRIISAQAIQNKDHLWKIRDMLYEGDYHNLDNIRAVFPEPKPVDLFKKALSKWDAKEVLFLKFARNNQDALMHSTEVDFLKGAEGFILNSLKSYGLGSKKLQAAEQYIEGKFVEHCKLKEKELNETLDEILGKKSNYLKRFAQKISSWIGRKKPQTTHLSSTDLEDINSSLDVIIQQEWRKKILKGCCEPKKSAKSHWFSLANISESMNKVLPALKDLKKKVMGKKTEDYELLLDMHQQNNLGLLQDAKKQISDLAALRKQGAKVWGKEEMEKIEQNLLLYSNEDLNIKVKNTIVDQMLLEGSLCAHRDDPSQLTQAGKNGLYKYEHLRARVLTKNREDVEKRLNDFSLKELELLGDIIGNFQITKKWDHKDWEATTQMLQTKLAQQIN